MVSAIVVRLPFIGFRFDVIQLFWLAAMPGLSGRTLRVVHTFLTSLLGTRLVISVAAFLKLIPCIGLGLAILNRETPFWIFLMFVMAGTLAAAYSIPAGVIRALGVRRRD